MNDYALTIVRPLDVTDSILITSGGTANTNVPETDYSAWSSGTTYAAGARVILTSTHRIYESLQATNLNKNPVTESLWWIEVAPTNRWACLDASVSTGTSQADNIKYTFRPGTVINALAALNLKNATQLTITVTSDSFGVVYSKSIDLLSAPVSPAWWDWFYGVRRSRTQDVELDLPSYLDCTIVVEIDGGSDLFVGVLMMGQQRRFGVGIEYGARVGIQDYSRKEKNDFGDTVLIERAFAKRANFSLMVAKAETDALQDFLSDIRATNCLWIGSTEYEATTVFGWCKNFEILISYPEHSLCELQLEGLT